MTNGSLRVSTSRRLPASLLTLWLPPPCCQGAQPVSDVAEAVAVAVLPARLVRSGRRRNGRVDEVLEAGDTGRGADEWYPAVSSYLIALMRSGEVVGRAVDGPALGCSSGLLWELVVLVVPFAEPVMAERA